MRGIEWSFATTIHGTRYTAVNTCGLDSLITGLYLSYRCCLMCTNFVELSDKNSLLSRSFADMDKHGTGVGGMLARSKWFQEIYPLEWYLNNAVNDHNEIDLYHAVDIFFNKEDSRSNLNNQGFNVSPGEMHKGQWMYRLPRAA